MLQKGVRSIEKELDLQAFVTMQKEMKITLKTIFTAAERQLIRNNQAFILNSSSSQTESDSQDETATNFDAAELRKALFFEPLLEGAF